MGTNSSSTSNDTIEYSTVATIQQIPNIPDEIFCRCTKGPCKVCKCRKNGKTCNSKCHLGHVNKTCCNVACIDTCADTSLDTMLNMGFSKDASQLALQLCKNDINKAIAWLITEKFKDNKEDKKDQDNGNINCSVCLQNDKNSVFIPCRHMTCCADCAKQITSTTKICPICRQVIKSVLEIFP